MGYVDYLRNAGWGSLTTSEHRYHSLACKPVPIEHSRSENSYKPQAASMKEVVPTYKALDA